MSMIHGCVVWLMRREEASRVKLLFSLLRDFSRERTGRSWLCSDAVFIVLAKGLGVGFLCCEQVWERFMLKVQLCYFSSIWWLGS